MKLKQRVVLGYFKLKLKLLELIDIKLAAKEAFKLLCTPYTRKRVYALPPIFDQGIKITHSYQQHTISGYVWKPTKPNNHKILICHGFDSASYKFAHYIPPLLSYGFEVMAFDAPAHGLSTGKTINVLQYSNFILEILNHFGPVSGIMAHSFGGTAAALANEQLPQGTIKKLVLIAPATETTSSINDFCKVLDISKALQYQLNHLVLSIAGKPISWYSVSRIVQAVTTPTLWLHDRNDKITPYNDMAHLQQLNLPHLQFGITEGLGHSLYNDKKVAETITRFFKEML